VGHNPPDNPSEDPSKLWIIRDGSGGSKQGSEAIVPVGIDTSFIEVPPEMLMIVESRQRLQKPIERDIDISPVPLA
jgi:hypothetical protein